MVDDMVPVYKTGQELARAALQKFDVSRLYLQAQGHPHDAEVGRHEFWIMWIMVKDEAGRIPDPPYYFGSVDRELRGQSEMREVVDEIRSVIAMERQTDG